MLNQTAAFKHGNLRELFTHLNAHHVAANGFTVAFFTATTLNQFCVGADYRSVAGAI
jgi:hypothetical protein